MISRQFSPPCTFLGARALTTHPLVPLSLFVKIDADVIFRKRVALFAVRLLAVVSSHHVDSVRDRFKVDGITAGWIAAKMINFQSAWDGFKEHFISNYVGIVNLAGPDPVSPKSAVALLLSCAHPYPTRNAPKRDRWIYQYLAEEARKKFLVDGLARILSGHHCLLTGDDWLGVGMRLHVSSRPILP